METYATAESLPGHERPSLRQRAVGPWSGLLHSLGLAALVVSEWLRHHVGSTDAASLAIDPYLRDVTVAREDLLGYGAYRWASDLFEAVCVGEPRAGLWAAVYTALLVRLNRHGPARAQHTLSMVAGGYCLLGFLAGLPLLVPIGAGFVILPVVCAGVMWLATR
ncbi:hypothetical protein [Streptomyces sp. RFCAC02]|uniref:hypothetical protein n=1 Tax=Streptomyces sp. RFCAC02 TaxID=2499143 RepID=UPI0010216E75|nr:hypothetical protein [Streptomyces sp. RFCAC02]